MAKNNTRTRSVKPKTSLEFGLDIGKGKLDIKHFEKPQAKNAEQALMLDSFEHNIVSIVNGRCGTGKTMLACHMAMYLLQTNQIKKIIITRSAHETGGKYESIGHLPGDIFSKLSGALYPMLAYFEDVLGSKSAVDEMIVEGKIEILPIGHLMGRTFKDCVVIFDECQLSGPTIMRTMLSRVGRKARVFAIGDTKQTDDITDKNGLQVLVEQFSKRKIKGFKIVTLTEKSIFRSEFVRNVEAVWESIETGNDPIITDGDDSNPDEWEPTEQDSAYLLDRAESMVN